MDERERLHKFIARCGLASRRAAEQAIREGRVEVNGEVVVEMGLKVGPGDQVSFDGVPIAPPELKYVLLNKPKGVVTTMDDPQRRRTVLAYLPDLGVPLKPVGRLDYDTSGMLVCTNDGELAARLTHPRYALEKEYRAVVQGKPSEETLERLRKGIVLDGRRTAPAQVHRIGTVKSDATELRVVIHEGRNRQIRRMLESVGHPVVDLKRVRIGPLRMAKMPPGSCRMLTKAEVRALQQAVGLA